MGVFYIDGMLFDFFYDFFLSKLNFVEFFISSHFFAFYAICVNFFTKTIIYHFMFSSRFILFPTFLEKNEIFRGEGGGGGGCKNNFVVALASEPVGGRSRATELPCSNIIILNELSHSTRVHLK